MVKGLFPLLESWHQLTLDVSRRKLFWKKFLCKLPSYLLNILLNLSHELKVLASNNVVILLAIAYRERVYMCRYM